MFYFVEKLENLHKICLKVENIRYLFNQVRQQGYNEYKDNVTLPWLPSTLLGPTQSIPHYTCDASEPNKVLGSLSNVIFPSKCIASLLPPCKEEINSY